MLDDNYNLISEEKWEELYSPIETEDSMLDFETVKELALMISNNKEENLHKYVWTIIEGANNELFLSNGFHVVNKIGYRVCKKPFDDTKMIDVIYVSEEDYD